MKKLLSLLTVATFLVAFSITEVSAQANPGGVQMIKDGTATFVGGCAAGLQSYSYTVQIKNGQVHLITFFFDVTGTCLELPAGSGAQSGTINIIGLGQGTTLTTPSGVYKVQFIVNPNQPTP